MDSCDMFEESGFYEENRTFFELVRSGAPAFQDIDSGLQSVEIADFIRKRENKYIK